METYAHVDVQALTVPLQHIARRLGRYFPTHLMDQNDLVQQGFLGLLRVTPQSQETSERRLKRQLRAGKCEMLDALRAFHDRRFPRGRKVDVLVENIDRFADPRHSLLSYEEVRIRYHDLLRLASRMSQRNQAVLWGRLRGYTLMEIAEMLKVTEGRVSQLQHGIVAFLRKEMAP